MDGGLCIWDLRSQQHVLKYSKHSDYVSGLTVSEKQQALLAVSGDGTLSVHDLRSRKPLARSEDDADDELISVAVVKNGKKVVCGSQSGVLAIWSWGYWNDCSDSSDDEGRGSSSRQRKKKREKTAMSKGRGKTSKAGNFFADLL
ncbi:WD40-repeat-containing domain protein [Scenedesmus sp. NREL 46B-D3]|nr:WD40-repeat-containing domain protein [Scenedesmus sp. NREL 46B-D3]